MQMDTSSTTAREFACWQCAGSRSTYADKLGPEQLRWYQAPLLPEKNITP